jgi:hypothetical protein
MRLACWFWRLAETNFMAKIVRRGNPPRYPGYCDARSRIPGEHKLPACKFRQPAETVARFNRSAGARNRCCRKAAGNCGLAARAPQSNSNRKSVLARRDRQHARRVRYPESCVRRACCYSPTLRCKMARAYSRLSLAMKLALISAGHTASHS